MAHLVDTSILCRLGNTADRLFATATNAILELQRRGEVLYLSPQVLIEFRSVATRPAAMNGMGLGPSDVELKSTGFESDFQLLTETPDIFPAWKVIVENLGVIGKQVHDARLVAVCHVYGLTHVLTFNTRDFARFSGFGPGIIVVDPATL
jgi:predicted nucleic acid-binding protein